MLAAVLTAVATPAFADELVTNGDFSAGNTGFQSTFTTNGSGAGRITITTDPDMIFGSFDSYGDHTTGTGNMLLVDPNSGGPTYFWQQTFAVAANSAYNVSLWGRQAAGGPAATIDARINGVSIGAFTPPQGSWQQFSTAFNSGSATSVTFSLFDLNTTNFFNDFTVDDISFAGPAATPVAAAVPEPTTWGMMMIGFGAIGGALRSKRRRLTLSFA